MDDPLRRDVTYGDGAVRAIPDVVERVGGRRVLLVTGKRSFEASGAAAMLPDLEARATVERWADFSPNTDAQDLAAGLQVVDGFAPDLVLAVGGGSAMDMAKLLCAYQGTLDEAAVFERIRAGGSVDERGLRLVLVPTTSGSGAEATRFAVVYIGDDKFSVAGPAMLPDAVVLDPSLALSGSPYQRATSGIDAVAQAIESMWATAATDRSRMFARHALRLLLPAIERFVNDADVDAARAMAIGSNLAGRAIDISRTTAAHALSYGITKGYGVPHGHAVALTLGAFIEEHAGAGPADLQDSVEPASHRAMMARVLTVLGADTPEDARSAFRGLLERIGLDSSLEAAGVGSDAERDALAANINTERLGNNPVAFDKDGLIAILARSRF